MTTLSELHAQDRIPLLGAIRSDAIQYLNRHADEAEVDVGDIIFREGDLGECLYIILDGQVEITQQRAGHPRHVVTFGQGDCFGEMALIDCQPRSATAIALAPSSLWILSSNTLFEFYRYDIEQFAILQMNLSREVIRRLRNTVLATTESPQLLQPLIRQHR